MKAWVTAWEFCQYLISGIVDLRAVFLLIPAVLLILGAAFYFFEKDAHTAGETAARHTLETPAPDSTSHVEQELTAMRRTLTDLRDPALPGRTWLGKLANSICLTFLGATVGLGLYAPKTFGGVLVMIMAGCVGVVALGAIAGLVVMAMQKAYDAAAGQDGRSERR